MSEFVSESLLTLLTVIIFMILLGVALSAINQVTGDGANPGLLDTFIKGLAGMFVKVA